MKTPAMGRPSAAIAGWLFAAVFAAWLVFLLVPAPKPPAGIEPPSVPPALSKLAAVGLPDNPDFAGLPEYFALWADKADWVNDRALFAYWSPATLDYSYFFEAVRRDGKVRFHMVDKPPNYDVTLSASEPQPVEHPLRFILTEHIQTPSFHPVDWPDAPDRIDVHTTVLRVPLEVPKAAITPLEPTIQGNDSSTDVPKRAPKDPSK
jgi:hypothetical protein